MRARETTFGPFVLDSGRMALLRAGEPVAIGQRGFALLLALAEANDVVSKSELMEAGWPGTLVEEGTLTVQIADLRKALGTRDDGSEWILPVPRVGYRLVRGARHPLVRLPALAVLPFQNLSGDPEEDYFADGIVDELISALSRFKSFAVTARSSSFARKGRVEDVREVARDLNVRYVLEGSVRRSESKLRLMAQLVDGGDGAVIWAHTFEGQLDDIFEFQDRITASVAALGEPEIQRAEIEYSRRERAGSMAAYDLYLRAVAKIYAFTAAANAEAITLLTRAIAIEPENGTYQGFLAWALEHRISISWPAYGDDDRERCISCACEAIERSSSDATIQARCGLALQLIGGEYEAGLLAARRSIELNPNDVVALINAGIAELVGGDLNRSLELLFRALELQPTNAYETMNAIGNVYSALGDVEEGLEWAKRARALNRSYIPTHWSLVMGYVQTGEMEEARKALSELLELVPDLTIEKFASTARTKDRVRDDMMVEALREV